MSGGCTYRTAVYPGADVGAPLAPPGGGRHPSFELRDGATHLTGVRLVVARPSLTIRGRVTRGGLPAADVVVEAHAARREFRPAARSISDVDGRFELVGLAAGEHTLLDPIEGAFEQRAAAGAADVHIALPARGTIAGELRGFSRVDRVSLVDAPGGRRATLRGTGFRFDELLPANYRVEAVGAAGEIGRGEVTVVAGQTATLMLKPEGIARIAGRLRDLRGGAPLAGVMCRAYGTTLDGAAAITDDGGRFELLAPEGLTTLIACQVSGRFMFGGASTMVQVGARGTTTDAEVWTVERRFESGSWPGIELDPATYTVTGFRPGGEGSGLRVGDRIVAVDGLRLPAAQRRLLVTLLGDHRRGEPYEIVVARDGAEQVVTVTNGALP